MRNLIQTLAGFVSRAPVSAEEMTRLRHYTVFTLLGAVTMAFYGGYNLAVGNRLLAALVFISAAGLVAGWWLLCLYPLGRWVYRVNGLLYAGLLLTMLVFGGQGGSKILWMYTFPLIAFFLLGKREGMAWSTGLLAAGLALIHLAPPAWRIHPYGGEFVVRFASTYLIVSLVTFWFEHFRESYRLGMEGEQRRLREALADKERSQRSLRNSQERFGEILSLSRDILYRRALRGGPYDYISDAFCRLLGYSREETDRLAYEGVEDLIHPEHRDRHQRLIAALLARDPEALTDPVIEYPMRHKNGRYRWFSDRLALVFNAAGEPESILGSNREITAQREAAEAVGEAHRQMLTILDSVEAHVYVADMQDHTILYMNHNMKQAFGGNLEGRICWQAFRGAASPCPHCKNAELLHPDGSPAGAVEWESFNPITRRHYVNYDRAIRWLDGRWVKLQIAFDVTRSKQLESERRDNEAILQRARKLEAIGTLAGGIAHDFNNLLTAIVGRVSLLEIDAGQDSGRLRHLEQIRLAAHRGAELANRLKTFSSGGEPLRQAGSVVDLLAKAAVHSVEGVEVPCRVEAAADLPPVAFDESQLLLALKNLVANGYEALPGGTVTLSAVNFHLERADPRHPVPPGRYVLICVSDHGRGIPGEHLERVFDPYFSTKQMGAQKGLGLGLAITHSIVKRHRGLIDVRSREGGGTTVSVYLPVHQSG